MTATSFSLSTGIDRSAAARTFAERGRVRVIDALEPSSAEALHDCMLRDVPWKLAYNRGAQAIVVDTPELRSLAPAKAQELNRTIVQGARHGFQ